ncbi:hypothetical protein [Natronolimnobius baerhuensis]|uniref:Uncharacterized protein n=1 Tax=Natronolimnobius baerhuensis TaxID=253108 RepID=A0A202E442_9EURY|nr:hypothetical protein [Natronolimnobius baerhuensis]OVE82999.1 hypothetical protein B2G88_18095 [Natronolimnobius baerhuensis]
MQSRSVTLEEIDELFLQWNGHINASALFRRALKDEMQIRDINPHEFRTLFEQAVEQGYEFDEILEQTSRIDDLEHLVAEQAESMQQSTTE